MKKTADTQAPQPATRSSNFSFGPDIQQPPPRADAVTQTNQVSTMTLHALPSSPCREEGVETGEPGQGGSESQRNAR